MPGQRLNGHYEVREHEIGKGLLSLVWIEQGRPPHAVLNFGDIALPSIARAVNEYLARHPALRVPQQPEGETA